MLDARALGAIRGALRALDLGDAGHEGLPLASLAALGDSMPQGVGLTLDLEGRAALGVPVVVLRPSEEHAGRAAEALSTLSEREREVASWVVRGLRNRDIAQGLHISLATVKDHVHRVLAKTGLRSRAELIARFKHSLEGGAPR